MKRLTLWRKLDLPLLVSALLLLTIGLIILNAINFKDASLAQNFSPTKQLVSAGLGLIIMTVLAKMDYRSWSKFAKYWYVAGICFLLLVLGIGTIAGGAKRAINLGFLQFQPAEFIKLGLIMMLAWFFAKHNEQMSRLRFVIYSAVFLIIPMLLIAIQPDLGSAVVLAGIWFITLLLSAAKKRQIAMLAVGLALLIPLSLNFLHDYQRQRLQTFLNPLSDPQGAGYNVVQSQIAVGSGGFFGKGLGSGSQSQLNFLPSQHTDFVFAVTAEKLGFVGAGLVLVLFVILIGRAFLITWGAVDRYSMVLAGGITAMLLIHVVINVGMNLGIMPVTGIPLPFMSYGGTNLIISLAAVGILLSIGLHRKELKFSN